MIDRVIQQTTAQVLTPIYEKQFSGKGLDFGPKKKVHDEMKRWIEEAD